MNDYFRAVTLGAFTWKNEERIALLLEYVRKAGGKGLLLQFVLLTFCLNFPVTFQIARLNPHELYSRLHGSEQLTMNNEQRIEDFNMGMLESGFGRNVMLPLLGMAFVLTLIIQAVFYLCTVYFLGLSRMNVTPLSFRERMGIALYSSTLPVLAAALFGMYLPTVHIIVYYFIIIFVVFQRSRLCPNG